MSQIVVLHAIPDLRQSAGGIAATVPALAGSLIERGIECRFLTFAHDSSFRWAGHGQTTRAEAAGLRFSRKPAQPVLDAIKAIPEGKKVVCHSHGLWHPLCHMLNRAAFAMDLPLVISLHGMLLPWARQNKRLRKDLAWLLYQRADLLNAQAIHVTSEAEYKSVAGSVPHDKLYMIPPGVNVQEYQPAAAVTRHLRTLLFLGRLHPVKNLEGLIDAFVRVAPRHWVLKLAGPEEEGHRAVLERLVGSLHAADRIILAGPAYGPEKDRLLAEADAVVLPSFTENFGAVVAEALAVARPVIASTGTPWQRLETERCGWWVDPGVAGLAGAIKKLAATHPAELTAMGLRGRLLVTREFGWDTAGSRMSELYSSLACGSGEDRANTF